MGKMPNLPYSQLMTIVSSSKKKSEISAAVILALHSWDKGNLSHTALAALLDEVNLNLRRM